MASFDQKAFDRFLLDNEVVGFFEKPIVLKSGRKSSWYVNWRKVAADVYLMDRLVDFLFAFVADQKLTPDIFYGVPEGATKLGVIATSRWARSQPAFGPESHALAMGRASRETPWLLDALHDRLADEYYQKLVQAKEIKAL